MITPTRLAELRRVAEAVLPEHWITKSDDTMLQYFVEFQPAIALALLDHIAAQDRALEVARGALLYVSRFCARDGDEPCTCIPHKALAKFRDAK